MHRDLRAVIEEFWSKRMSLTSSIFSVRERRLHSGAYVVTYIDFALNIHFFIFVLPNGIGLNTKYHFLVFMRRD